MMNNNSGSTRRPAMSMKLGDITLTSSEADAIQGGGSGIRVLIVEDERDTLMTLGVLLRSEEFTVEMASSGAEAVQCVANFQPHIVLLDIGLPGRDGYEVASELRSVHGDACPTLIALTAYSSSEDKARAQASGFHHHISKPYDPIRLLAVLATMGRMALT